MFEKEAEERYKQHLADPNYVEYIEEFKKRWNI